MKHDWANTEPPQPKAVGGAVMIEYKRVASSESAERRGLYDADEVLVFEVAYTDTGHAYPKLIEVRQSKSKAMLERYVQTKYEGRIVKQLVLVNRQLTLF